MGVSFPMTTTEVVISQRITVDSEIADEIVWLNANGVRTEGSCSGHGIVKPTAMIKPSSADKARELGYTPWLVEDLGLYEIKLRGQVPDSGLTLEETGEQPYADARFSAGLVEDHAHDTIYLKLEREGEESLTVLLRRDEALAVIWLLAGALWSESIQQV